MTWLDYDAVVPTEPGLQHWWKCHEASGAASLADSGIATHAPFDLSGPNAASVSGPFTHFPAETAQNSGGFVATSSAFAMPAAFSIELWMLGADIGATATFVADYDFGGVATVTSAIDGSGNPRLSLVLTDVSSVKHTLPAATGRASVWNHWVFTFDGNRTLTGWLNGVLAQTFVESAAIVLSTATQQFVVAPNVSPIFCEVAIYDHVLSAGTIARHYAVGVGAKAGLAVLIDGTDYSAQVEGQSLQVSLPTTKRGATARFDVLDTTLALQIGPLDTVVINDVDGVTPLFSGVITRPTVMVEGIGVINRWKCQAQDATYYMDSTVVNEVYSNMTADAIVKALMAKYLPTVTTVHVQPGPAIAYIIFSHRTLTQALRKLVKQAQISGIVIWYLDAANDLHWGTIGSVPSSGATLSDVNADILAGAIQYEPRTFSYDQDGTQIINNVIVRGATAASNARTDTFTGDGNSTQFALAYTPSQVQGAMLPVVTVGGVGQTVAFDTGSAPSTQWVVGNQVFGSATSVPGTSFIRLGTAAAPGAGVVVTCQYQYDVPTLVQMSNAASIAKYNKPGSMTKGKHTRHIVDQTIRTPTAAIAKAQSHLASYAYHIPTTKVTVPESYVGTQLRVGQSIAFTCSQVGYSAVVAITAMVIKGTADGLRKIQLTMEQP